MPGHTLLVHPDVDDWMQAQPDLRRRVDWLLFELTTRGDAWPPEGDRRAVRAGHRRAGRALAALRGRRLPLLRLVVPGHRAGTASTTAGRSWCGRCATTTRCGPWRPARRTPTQPASLDELDPLTEEQRQVDRPPRPAFGLVVGQPGTGKTGALIFTAVEEARRLPPDARLLYVTLSRRLVSAAQEVLDGRAGALDDGSR